MYILESQDSALYIFRGHTFYFSNNITFLSLMIYFAIANNADPDDMLHHTLFHLGLHCLSNYPLRGFRSSSVKENLSYQYPYTTLTNFSTTYVVKCKVYTDVVGIK